MTAPFPLDEPARLEALERYRVLDTDAETSFDDLTLLAAQICSTPIALVSLLDRDRQWFKSRLGVTPSETPWDIAFCAHAILQPDVMVVEDALADERFSSNPLVTGEAHIRFYAGAPLFTPTGQAIGTICVLDRVPRRLDAGQIESLRALGRQTITQLELRRRVIELAESVSEQKRVSRVVEEIGGALRESEERFRLLFDKNPLPTWVYDLESLEFLEVNAVAVSAYGYSRDEFLKIQITDIVPPEDVPRTLERVRLFRERPGQQLSGLRRHRHKDGSILEAQVDSSRFEFAGRWEVLVVAEDITERRRLLNALRKSEELFRSIVETAQEGIWSIDAEGRTTFVNRRMAEMLGSTAEDVAGAPLLAFLDGESQGAAFALLGHRRKGVVEQRDVRFQRADGTQLWALLSISPLHDSRGLFAGGLAMVNDITERKLAEQKLRSFTLRLEQSNHDLNDFASVAAHDLQEPLRKIQAFGDRLKKRFGADLPEDGFDYLERMLGATRRMQHLIDSLLDLSRVTTKAQPPAPVDLGRVVTEVLADLEVTLDRTGGRVEASDLPTIHADRLQMRQLLQNLIDNALKFQRPDVPPLIRIGAAILPRPPQARASDSSAPELYQITVQDNGIGFEETYLDRIFKPFERLHGREQYEGTGMGLAICRKIAERHGGSITARSTPGQGSRFLVTLPVRPPEEKSLR